MRTQGNYSNGIIVEVKRFCGDGLQFIQICRTILEAVEGKEAKLKPRVIMKKAVSDMECIKNSQDQMHNITNHIKEALNLSEQYLQDDRDDLKILGLQSLTSLMDIENCSHCTITAAIKAIICGQSNPGIKNTIMSFLQHKYLSNPNVDTNQDKFHRLALILMLKTFKCYVDLCLEGCCMCLNENPWIVEILIPILVNDLKNIKSKRLEALTACKCLNEILPISEAVKDKALECGFLEAINQALILGKKYCDKTICECEKSFTVLKYYNQIPERCDVSLS